MKPGLLIIDMQEICIETIGEKEFSRALQPQLATIDHFRRKGYLIGLVEYQDLGPTAPEILKALPKEKSDTYFRIEKNSDDLFKFDYPTAIVRQALRRTETTDLAYSGAYALDCVRKTMIGSKDKKVATNFTATDLIVTPKHTPLYFAINMIRYARLPVFKTHIEMIEHLEARVSGANVKVPRAAYHLPQ